MVYNNGSQLQYLSVPSGYLQDRLAAYRDDSASFVAAADATTPACTYYVLFPDRVIGLAQGNTGFVSMDRSATGAATSTPGRHVRPGGGDVRINGRKNHKATPHNSVCGALRKFCPRILLRFLAIHQVLPQKRAASGRKIFSQIAFAKLCGVAKKKRTAALDRRRRLCYATKSRIVHWLP